MTFFQRSDEEPGRSLWNDFRSGSLSTFGRIAMSVVAFGAALAMVLMGLAVMEERGRVGDQQIAVVLCVGGVLWLLALGRLWWGHRVVGPVLGTLVLLGILWTTTIMLGVLVAEITRSEETWIGAIVVLSCSATILIITERLYRGIRGRRIVTLEGQINVHCASCGYSLVGKNDCTCPECGRRYTIDELILLQDYDALRRRGRSNDTGASGDAGASEALGASGGASHSSADAATAAQPENRDFDPQAAN